MNRKKIIKEIGKLQPSVSSFNNDELNFSSIFIVPIIHKLHETKDKDIKKLFSEIENEWEIKNNSIAKDLSLGDVKEYIKDNIFEDINKENEKELKNFIYDRKNIYLSYN